jgi:hypothetical protein
MSTLDMSDEVVPVEEVASTSETDEPNITTTVEDVSDEESVVSSDEEVAKEPAEEVAEPEPVQEVVEPEPVQEVVEEVAKEEAPAEEPAEEEAPVKEPAEEPAIVEESDKVVSSDNDLENRVKELEERLEKFINYFKISQGKHFKFV